jgi:tetraacyldisaccharide 4'-kinase
MSSRGPAVRGVSEIWSALSWGARKAAERGWLQSTRLPVRVVSVGNIQAGGAGKTPLVAQIAREAHERGLKACILCRGYGGEWEARGGLILPEAPAPLASECGDEAALLHDLAPHAVIGVGADRVRQFERAREEAGAPDLVILDDGFQHWKIRKDLEIVALTSAGRGQVPYRDWAGALGRAGLLVWTKGEARPKGLESGPWARVRYRLPAPPASMSAAGFWLVSGVADGRSVETLARASGYRIERHVSFPDHARYSEPMVQDLAEEAARAGVRIALTGKDWVKWRGMAGMSRLEGTRIAVLEPELEWVEGRERWNRVLWGA